MDKEEVKRYRCIKECTLQKCDDDGFMVDNEYMYTEVGSVWQESLYMISGGKDSVHLDREDGDIKEIEWCEPLIETLQEYFEQIESIYI